MVSTDQIKLLCVIEFDIFISVEFDWKVLGSPINEHSINIGGWSPTTPELAQLELELTLTKRLPARLQQPGMPKVPLAEEWFTDEAFRTKKFTVHLQQGRFPAPAESHLPEGPLPMQRFQLRLAFEPSVFPPYSEWRAPSGAPAAYKFWQWKEFCARVLPDTAIGRVWDSCLVM